MSTATSTDGSPAPLKAKDFKSKINPDWCPGCGDFGVLACLQKACAELGLQPHQVVTVSGIGCSSNLPGYINTFGMHTLHGRSLAVATGVKMGNHELTVLATGGDGDGYGIGGNHFTHTARRNVDLTYIVMNNQIYGLTTGQVSPASRPGMKTKSTPFGNVERSYNPVTSAIMNGATFVARGFSGHAKQLVDIMKKAILHKGFAFVDTFSPCVTFNKDNTFNFFRDRIKHLEDVDHDTSDWKAACEYGMAWDEEIWTGIYFESEYPTLGSLEPVLDEGGPMATRSLGLSDDEAAALKKKLM
ncbi:MAG: 2-oxoacid:ferredoxin oxidoreductase subunit beta [Planctomycetota bacterium]|jgi:2-oxoglutarate ferredoxin oxidoreductase subunit beta